MSSTSLSLDFRQMIRAESTEAETFPFPGLRPGFEPAKTLSMMVDARLSAEEARSRRTMRHWPYGDTIR